jgi:hypothetical protein
MKYDYTCEANGQTLEVNHGISVKIKTWGELCEILGISPGDTPEDAPVRRLIGLTIVLSSKPVSSGSSDHTASCCCGSCGDPRQDAMKSQVMKKARKELHSL